MSRLFFIAMLCLASSCDPELNMSGPKQNRRSIEECPEAVERVKHCCPQYESYVSCTVLESWEGMASPDLSEKQSHCLRASDCDAVEKAISGGSNLCGVSFRGHHCH